MTVYHTDADLAYGGEESVDPAASIGRAVVPLVNWAGAMASLALVAGMALWGYNLAMRDVSGIPVIQALEGPMRVQPDDPGGRQADHQGLAVNAVQADGVAADPEDRIVLAPRPIDLSTATPARNAPTVADASAGPPEVQSIALTTETEIAAAPAPAAAQTGLAVEALISDLVAEEEANSVEIVPASLPGIARSPRPPARPEIAFASRAVFDLAAPAQAAPEQPSFVDPATLAEGTRMVQFGAFDDEAAARQEWEGIAANFGDYLDGKAPVIQSAERAGRQFFRLRATGFEDLSDARRFCAVFLAAELACIPVVYK